MHNIDDVKPKRKRLFRILYILATILAIVLIGTLDTNFKKMFEALTQLNLLWITAGFGCLIMFWLSDAVLMDHITAYTYKKVSFWRSFKVGLIGLYYGALTPFATGGQPMQVIYMRKDKVPVGIATCIVTLKFMVYEISLCAFYLIAMLLRGGYFYSNYNEVFWFTTLGFAINLFAVVFIGIVIINKNIAKKICTALVHFFHRIKVVKDLDKTLGKIDETIEEFTNTAQYILQNKGKVVVSFFISIINLAFLFAIPYFIYVAFGHSEKSLMDIMTLQSFLYLAVSFFPLPGAAGASEGGFYLFFSAIFTNVPVLLPMLIWRFISYYCVLITGSIYVVLIELHAMHKESQMPKQAQLEKLE